MGGRGKETTCNEGIWERKGRQKKFDGENRVVIKAEGKKEKGKHFWQ